MSLIFYAQQGEDVYVYNNFINKKRHDGIFVELGGMDGITYTNTKFFEDELDFKGVLIEPTDQFEQLKINRPKCDLYNIAVNYSKEKVKFIGNSATAGLVETMNADFTRGHHSNSTVYYVDGEPFSEILAKSNIKYIDLLTIDVEGGEQVVLETMNFDIPTYVIVVELDGLNKVKDEACRKILRTNGFTLDIRMAINEFWINNNYFRKNILYDETIPKFTFNSIYDLGQFKCIEQSIISEVERCLRYNNKTSWDYFVLSYLNHKTNGVFFEIGSGNPIQNNNSYRLEKDYNWTGLIVDQNNYWENQYKIHRPNSRYIIYDDAQINFEVLFDIWKFPKNIDYLHFNNQSIQTLENINQQLMDQYKFATITCKHNANTLIRSREIFANHGYIRISETSSEDWYIHPDLVDKIRIF